MDDSGEQEFALFSDSPALGTARVALEEHSIF